MYPLSYRNRRAGTQLFGWNGPSDGSEEQVYHTDTGTSPAVIGRLERRKEAPCGASSCSGRREALATGNQAGTTTGKVVTVTSYISTLGARSNKWLSFARIVGYVEV
jgi:hypothetical protein